MCFQVKRQGTSDPGRGTAHTKAWSLDGGWPAWLPCRGSWRSRAGPDHVGPGPQSGFWILYECRRKPLRHSEQERMRMDLGFEKFTLATVYRMGAAGQGEAQRPSRRPRHQSGAVG